MPRTPKVKGQTAMDEVQLDDPELESALEEREEWKERIRALRGTSREKDKAALGLLVARLPQDGEVFRIGRFRIERKETKKREVAFTVEPKVRIAIATDRDDE